MTDNKYKDHITALIENAATYCMENIAAGDEEYNSQGVLLMALVLKIDELIKTIKGDPKPKPLQSPPPPPPIGDDYEKKGL